jgi:hypothetical protein
MKSSSKFSPTKLKGKNIARPSKFRSLGKASAGSDLGQKKNRDLPTKQEVDADQEMDNVTWADR